MYHFCFSVLSRGSPARVVPRWPLGLTINSSILLVRGLAVFTMNLWQYYRRLIKKMFRKVNLRR